jgi:hypothetical protein
MQRVFPVSSKTFNLYLERLQAMSNRFTSLFLHPDQTARPNRLRGEKLHTNDLNKSGHPKISLLFRPFLMLSLPPGEHPYSRG